MQEEIEKSSEITDIIDVKVNYSHVGFWPKLITSVDFCLNQLSMFFQNKNSYAESCRI